MLARFFLSGLLLGVVGQAQQPMLQLTHIPAFGSFDDLTGIVTNADPAAYAVATFVFLPDLGWFTKPTCAQPLISPGDGTFRVDVTTGGIDQAATKIAVYLVPASFVQSCVEATPSVPQATRKAAVSQVVISRSDPSQKALQFSGYRWLVRSSPMPVSPGPNIFAAEGASVDSLGRLHLTVEKRGNLWTSSEVILSETLGYGTFRFFLDSSVDGMDPNIVLGMFSYSDDPEFAHRELDVEISRWKTPAALNSQFVVQPFTNNQNILRYVIPPGLIASTHSFAWGSSSAAFSSHAAGQEIQKWTRSGPAVPPSSDETVHLNLWLIDGDPPSDGRSFEVIFSRFEFEPLLDSGGPRLAAVANAANGLPSLSPGNIASIYGASLAQEAQAATTIPLPVSLRETSVWIGGFAAPLYYVSPGQINFQVPYEVRPGETRLVVVRQGFPSSPTPVRTESAAPGIFAYGIDGRCVAQNQDGALNTTVNPAVAGSALVLYLSGIGDLDHPVQNGMSAAAIPLSRAVLPAKATIGGSEARIAYLGLTPGSVGLAQANLQVPQLVAGTYPVSVENRRSSQ